MSPETKTCQSCKTQFIIEPVDFSFYEKIKVPAPTWCPECRRQRRLAFRNERSLYRRECGLCKKSIISMYHASFPAPVYCVECWWSDKWDPMEYGRAYDFSKPFFVQFYELVCAVPRLSPAVAHVANSEYCNYVADAKDCYLCFGSIKIENCAYGSPYESRDCFDSLLLRESELCYECIDCEKLYSCAFCQDCSGSSSLMFCYDCQGCDDCIGCVGLRQKKYHIFNKPKTKEEYEAFRKRLETGEISFGEVVARFEELKLRFPRKFARILNSENVSGNYIVSSKNAHSAFAVKKAEDCKFVVQLIEAKDCYDANYCEMLELCYEHMGYYKNHAVQFCSVVGESNSLRYSDYCANSANLFGCAGLRKKQFCILNRQYSELEYKILTAKIQAHMDELPYQDKVGRIYKYGEYFPLEFSPFAYNESVAYEFFPLNEDQVLAKGFVWRESEEKTYAGMLKERPPICEVNEEILKQVLTCAHEGRCSEKCTIGFKLIPTELTFYRRMKLPLPLLCPNCRHFARLNMRMPYKLWHRQCMCDRSGHAWHQEGMPGHSTGSACGRKFETTYAPERPEIVYCEQCYQAEVI